jgi:hypothetical protein
MPAMGLNQEFQKIIDEQSKEIDAQKAMQDIYAGQIAELQEANARLTQALKEAEERNE